MDVTECAASGCDRPTACKGYCSGHYYRLRTGAPIDDPPLRRYGQRECSAPDCAQPHYCGGYCTKHYDRWRQHGTVADPDLAWPVCTVEGCDRRGRKRGAFKGLCRKHEERMRLHGTTDEPWADLETRIAEHYILGPEPAHRPDLGPCHLWTGFTDEYGYARIRHAGRSRRVHSVRQRVRTGKLMPLGWTHDHLCTVTWCVNEGHLEVVTGSENTIRMNNNRRDGISQRAKAAAVAAMAEAGYARAVPTS